MISKKLWFLPYTKLQHLIDGLVDRGFACIGPQVKAGAIVYDYIQVVEQLPWGVIDHQMAGSYRLEKTNLNQAFAWTNGPQAIKPYLFKSDEVVWCAEKTKAEELIFRYQKPTSLPLAFLGARACDLAGMAIQDKIFMHDQTVDQFYKARKDNFLVIAVECNRSSKNCFCVSTGDGPQVTKHFDLAMNEINDGFVVRVGTARGEEIVSQLNLNEAQVDQLHHAENNRKNAICQQTKKLPPVNLRDLLFANLDHPRWEKVAKRCLSCTNCTQVCPTCFCQGAIEDPNLAGIQTVHRKAWDSCFTDRHSYIHGNLIRDTTRKRYRQWLTHKVGSWYDQFGVSGCVGCGRCITWCPVGIDLTVELDAIYRKPLKDK